MHDHPYRDGVRHYHRGGLDAHTHHRWHVLVDGVAVPAGLARSEAAPCEYPDGKRVIVGYRPGAAVGDAISSVTYREYSPDGKWYQATSLNCVSTATPGHPRYDPSAGALYRGSQGLCDDEAEHVWHECESFTSSAVCPDEDKFDDGAYEGDWVACNNDGTSGPPKNICRATGTERPAAAAVFDPTWPP